MSSNLSSGTPMMRPVESRCTLVLSRRTILDTLFVSKSQHSPRGKPAYATTTTGSDTTLWRVDDRGRMSEVSQIIWPTTPSQSPQLLINGQIMQVSNVLQRSKSLFGSNSRTFVAGNMRCKWKSGKTGTLYTGTEHQSNIGGSVYTTLQAWTCYENTNPSARSPPAGSSSFPDPPVVALFFPPQTGFLKSELTIYPNGESIIDHIVLTALLICARRDEWRSSQSIVTSNELEASLKAEMRGSLPPYPPAGSAIGPARPRTSPSVRRPHTAAPARTRRASSQAPPPYTSVDDISSRPR